VYGSAKEKAAADQLAALYPGAKVEEGAYSTQLVLTIGDDYAAAHPKMGSGAPTAGSTTPGGGQTTPSGPLPTDIANNSRTADQDICSGITAGYGAGTG
jgi:hypothetical protein